MEEDTQPMAMALSDRVALERRLDHLSQRVEERFHMWQRDRELFYQTRMVPLEQSHLRIQRLLWFLLGLSVAVAMVGLTLLASHVAG